jgi:hypothetical protein
VVGAASGAGFAVLALIAFLLALGPDETTGLGILDYYVEHDAAVKWQAAIFDAAFSLSNFPAATLLLASALALRETRLLPEWSAVAAAVVGLFLVVRGSSRYSRSPTFWKRLGSSRWSRSWPGCSWRASS